MLRTKSICTLVLLAAFAACSQPGAHAQWWKNVMNQTNGGNSQFNQGLGGSGFGNNSFGNNGFGNSGFGTPGYNGGGVPNLSSVSDSMRNIERAADQIAKQSMFTPSGNGAALALSLNTIKEQARQARRAADSNNPQQLMGNLNQLQNVTGNALSVAQRSGQSGYTISQIQMMQQGVAQSVQYTNSINFGGGSGYNPYSPIPNGGGFNPGMGGAINAPANGGGTFTLMGQTLMGIKKATIVMNPMNGTVNLTISQGMTSVNLNGTMSNQMSNVAMVNITGSDRGAASGMLNVQMNGNSLRGITGQGTMNGQPFSISFSGR